MKEYQGRYLASGMKFGIVASRFNELIVKNLLEGALDALIRHGAEADHIAIAWVPGAFEMPLAARQMALSGNYDAVICLGAVIRGATAHFDFVAGQAAAGIAKAAQESGIPVLFGVLTPDSIEQGLERAGTKAGNKGFDVALSAIEMADLMRQMREPPTLVKQSQATQKAGGNRRFNHSPV